MRATRAELAGPVTKVTCFPACFPAFCNDRQGKYFFPAYSVNYMFCFELFVGLKLLVLNLFKKKFVCLKLLALNLFFLKKGRLGYLPKDSSSYEPNS